MYQVSYRGPATNGEVVTKTFASFSDAHYHALSLRNCGYTVDVSVVRKSNPRTAERRYVAISHYNVTLRTNKPIYSVWYVGNAGGSAADVEETARLLIQRHIDGSTQNNLSMMAHTVCKNLFVVTESVAKRSYQKAWKAYQQEQEVIPTQAATSLQTHFSTTAADYWSTHDSNKYDYLDNEQAYAEVDSDMAILRRQAEEERQTYHIANP